nr:12330_t:CDS:2 [Entrophospora candida]
MYISQHGVSSRGVSDLNGDYKLFEDTDSEPSVVTDSENNFRRRYYKSSDTSRGGSSKIIQEKEPTEGNQKKDIKENQESEEEYEDIDSNSTISDQEEGYKTEESLAKRLKEFESKNKINQKPITPNYIDSDQESDTERLHIKNIPSKIPRKF